MSVPADGAAPSKLRVRRFKVERKFDGASGIRIEIILGGREPLLRVGLRCRRSAVEVPLGDVAEWVLVRDAKARAAAKAAAKKANRRRR